MSCQETCGICDGIFKFILAIVGPAIGGWIAFFFGKKLADRQHIRDVAKEFQKAFLDELIFLKGREGSEVELYHYLEGAFEKHERAVFVFQNYLDEEKKADLEKLWKAYCCDEDGHIDLLQYQDVGNDKKECLKSAIARLQKLFDFASVF